MKHTILFITITGLASVIGCAAATPYIAGDAKHIEIMNSPNHQFTYINVSEDKETEEYVIYGKLAHPHSGCTTDAAVTVANTPAAQTASYSKQLTMHPQSQHIKGWSGAGFRDRIPLNMFPDATMILSISDVPCR